VWSQEGASSISERAMAEERAVKPMVSYGKGEGREGREVVEVTVSLRKRASSRLGKKERKKPRSVSY